MSVDPNGLVSHFGGLCETMSVAVKKAFEGVIQREVDLLKKLETAQAHRVKLLGEKTILQNKADGLQRKLDAAEAEWRTSEVRRQAEVRSLNESHDSQLRDRDAKIQELQGHIRPLVKEREEAIEAGRIAHEENDALQAKLHAAQQLYIKERQEALDAERFAGEENDALRAELQAARQLYLKFKKDVKNEKLRKIETEIGKLGRELDKIREHPSTVEPEISDNDATSTSLGKHYASPPISDRSPKTPRLDGMSDAVAPTSGQD